MTEVLLCDADGNLFGSEEPAFDASARVTNRLMAELNVPRRFKAEELRRASTGKNFRTTAAELAAAAGVRLAGERLERWAAEERRAVTAHLRRTLTPDERVTDPLRELARRFRLAAVSSSALSRLDACFEATGLAELFPPQVRYSAEDSLPVPTSKPDPAVYVHALRSLGVEPEWALAVEDAAPGVRAAVAAGVRTIGNVLFVPHDERPERVRDLEAAGALAVIDGWHELNELLAGTVC